MPPLPFALLDIIEMYGQALTGFGVPVDVVSWGSMLNEAQNELILGKWWQLVAATTAMISGSFSNIRRTAASCR